MAKRNQQCKECGLKRASFGHATTRRRLWCGGCATLHAGAVYLDTVQMCEDCGVKRPGFGLRTEGRRRW
eukprot:SAG11_NODE_24502_length_372_cov_1.080586_1_plen_68_part_10